MLERIGGWLAAPRAPLWLALFAVLLCLPALPHGRQADDHLFPWKLEQGAPVWSLFEIEHERVHEAMDTGFLVWWTSPHLYGRFFRPLSSLSHALDFTLWPQALWWMRLCNALVYGASVLLAALLYRRLAPAIGTAGLAALLFAIDDSHAFSAGWISGRNTLLALMFSLLALWLHMRAREQGSRWLGFASAASVALALGSAEAGVGALTLLVSYALVLESGSLLARLRTLSAPLAVGGVWALIYRSLGCGFDGASFYRHPAAPLYALSQGLLDVPVWFSDMFGPSGFPASLLYPSFWVRLLSLPFAALFAWLLWPALRASRACRFFAVAFALGLVPLLFTLPNTRMLIGPSFGALGWVACSIDGARAQKSVRARFTLRTLIACHLVLAALAFFPALSSTQHFARGSDQIAAFAKEGQELILVDSPVELLSNYTLMTTGLRSAHRPQPSAVHQLYTGSSPFWVKRVDARTLEIEVERGWGAVPIERIFCALEDMPRTGAEIHLPAFTARVLESTADGRPQRVRFTFPTPLESPGRTWLSWPDNVPAAWSPPKVGERVRLTPRSFFAALRSS